MRRTLFFALLFSAGPALAADPDPKHIAERIIGQVAGVREGEVVLIGAPDSDLELAAQLAWAVRRRKADSLTVVRREIDERRSYDELPPALDGLAETANLKLVDIIDVQIYVSHRENPALLEDVPPARRQARAQALSPVEEAFLKKGVRYVDIGNALFPTEATAKRFGLSKAALSKIFWSAIDVDYAALAARGEAVKAALSGKQAHITHPNGTDLKVGIAERPIFVSDGVMSDADKKTGGAAVQVWLPAGEVYVVPVAGTAEGTLVIDRSFVDGQEVLGLSLTLKAGKVIAMDAKKGLEALDAVYDAAGEGRDRFGVIDLGINPALIAPAGSKLQSWVAAGTITMGFGNDLWAGGTNSVAFGHYGHLLGTTLKVDGRVVVKDGKLAVGGQ